MDKVKLTQQSLQTYYREYSSVMKALNKFFIKNLSEIVWIYLFDVEDKKYQGRNSIVKYLYKICKEDDYYWNVYNRECINRAFKEFKIVDSLDFIQQEIGNFNFIELGNKTKTFYGKRLKHKHFLYHKKTKKVLIIGVVNLDNFLKCEISKCTKCSKNMMKRKLHIRRSKNKSHVVCDPSVCKKCRKSIQKKKNGKSKDKKEKKSKSNYEIEYITSKKPRYRYCRKNKCAKGIDYDENFCKKHGGGR
jgi:hypothetical protein